MNRLCVFLFACATSIALSAETCTTQSQMQPAERDTLVRTALAFAQQVQSNDVAGVKSNTIAQVSQDFAGIQNSITDTAPHVKSGSFAVNSLFVLDASAPATAASKPQDAQFFCNLNRSASEVSFSIPALPQGRYALAIVDTASAPAPWQIAFLLQKSVTGPWLLAGFYPRATTAANHDGLWFWKQGRDFATRKQSWNAWLNYEEAEQLLRPVSFMTSTHLDKLHDEWSKAAPTALSAGIRPEAPLVIRAKDGTEFRLTSLSTDNSLANAKLDVAIHIAGDAVADPVAARARNLQAARAFVAAYPELRDTFHGVWIFADSPSGGPFASEEPMERLQL